MTSRGFGGDAAKRAAKGAAGDHGPIFSICDDPILTRDGTCQLSLLSDIAFERGLARIRGDATQDGRKSFPTNLRIFATMGRKD